MKEKWIMAVCVLLIAALLGACRKPVVQQPAEESERDSRTQDPFALTYADWKSAYAALLDDSREMYQAYALVFVDGDDMPELYLSGVCEAVGDLVCTFRNGKLVEQRLYRIAGGKYVERSGKLINQVGHMGCFYDTAYALGENGFSELLNAYTEERNFPIAEDDCYTVYKHYVGNTEVTQEEYQSAVNAVMDVESAVSFYDAAVSYEAICEQLEAWEEA